jgi:hydrogenase-4 component H
MSIEFAALPEIDPALCRAVGACVRACPGGVLALDGRGVRLVNPAACDYCGRCEDVCPTGAITCPYVIRLALAAPTAEPPPHV